MIITAVLILLTSLLLLFLSEPVRGKQDGQEHNQFNWDDVKALLVSRNYVALLLVDMLIEVGTQFQTIWMTVFYADESGLGTLIPLVTGVPALLSILFIYPFGILVDRVQYSWPKNGRLKVVLVGQVRLVFSHVSRLLAVVGLYRFCILDVKQNAILWAHDVYCMILAFLLKITWLLVARELHWWFIRQ